MPWTEHRPDHCLGPTDLYGVSAEALVYAFTSRYRDAAPSSTAADRVCLRFSVLSLIG